MRREYITYSSDIPVSISFANIKEYPIHWNNSMEIIFVLKGKINVTIDSSTYELSEKQLEIVNIDESHKIISNSKENEVLIFHFDNSFFSKYYNDIENLSFYTNTTDEGAQNTEGYVKIRRYLSILLYEITEKKEDYDEAIEKTLVKLLYHLINNFHYLTCEKEELKENEEQLARYHRIAKYIYNNYNNKISLQEIAKKEFLSTHYLSHEIKYAMGYTFTDLLNLTRVEESVKLLLETDKTVSEISEEVGFSHTRYYNKHFKIHFKCTPLQYRNKYKVDEEGFEKQKIIKYYDLKESLNSVINYLETYERFNYENKIYTININTDDNLHDMDKKFKQVINLGEAFDLLIEDNKDILEEIQEEISFEYGRISNMFSVDMGIFPSTKFYNWNRVKSVLEYLDGVNLKPLIVLNGKGFKKQEFIEALKNFLEYFQNIETLDIHNFKFQFIYGSDKELFIRTNKILKEYDIKLCENEFDYKNNIDYIYDTIYMLPFIIHNIVNCNGNLNFLKAFDVLETQVNLTNEVFFGYPGLINDMGIKKPAYYAYYLLNKLGDIVVCKGNGYIVTKSSKEVQILLYSYNEDIDKLVNFKDFSNNKGLKNNVERKISLNVINLLSDVRMILYNVNEKIGSSYNYWLGMGSPTRLSKEEKQILYKASFPKINFKYDKKSTVLNIVAEIKNYGATLILIKKIPKHLK